MMAEKISRKKIDALVALACLGALERLKDGTADDEDLELIQNSADYLRKQGKIK